MYEEDVNIIDIEEEDLSTEQEAFKAVMQKHAAISKNFQYTSDGFTFDNIPKYNWSYV
ncbi:7889_t:CDS:2, partial [Gigaspora margarita]